MNPTKIIPISEAVVIVGGYGDVQKATFAGSNHTIAVKRLRPQGDFYSRVRTIAVRYPYNFVFLSSLIVSQALVRELKVWADLRHNNVLLLQGFHIDSPSLECAWIITLWHERGNISDYIIRTQPDEAARLKLVSHLCDPELDEADFLERHWIQHVASRICTAGLLQCVTAISNRRVARPSGPRCGVQHLTYVLGKHSSRHKRNGPHL